ncbi:hypothetical protein BX600DRAFT_430964 [Xylariales sp. PMI_506]|nr:hypothetical protein BX600DRAFT_430964 [Xylariales sp. PMI_506]
MISSKGDIAPIRLLPTSTPAQVVSTPLSILDSTCARFADTGAIWFFEAPAATIVDDEFLESLRITFVKTLDDFPQWAGQLHWAPFRPGGSHTERFNRCMITYGSPADPGAEWSIKYHDLALDAVTPRPSDLSRRIWDGDAFPQASFVPSAPLALSNLKDFEGRPSLAVQVNVFACGGYAIGVKVAHPLADIKSLMIFVHRWAAICRGGDDNYDDGSGLTDGWIFGKPLFDPAQLDARAAGDIDAAVVDPAIAARARALPLHRFDWWHTNAPGYPPLLVASSKNCIPPAEVLDRISLSPSTEGPWSTWDLERPASFGLLHITGDEIDSLQELARRDVPKGNYVSRLDALLAHLFRLVTRARAFAQADDDKVFLDVSLDARRRCAAPAPALDLLPEAFIGSPIFMTHIGALAAAIRDASLGELALQLRGVLQQFTPKEVADMLHDAAHEVSPQRLWLGFLGSLHLIATSWQRLRAYEIDFHPRSSSSGGGGGGSLSRPAYVHAVMQRSDGMLVIMDSMAPDRGVDVHVYLDSEAMDRLREELAKELRSMHNDCCKQLRCLCSFT